MIRIEITRRYAPKVRTLPALLTLLLVLATAVAAVSEDLVLRFAPVEGTQYAYALDQRQEINVDLGAMGNQAATNTSRMEFTVTALDRSDDGNTRLALRFGRMVMSAVHGGATVFALDTAKLDQQAHDQDSSDANGTRNNVGEKMAEAMRSLLAADLTATFTPRGEIVRIEGLEKAWDQIRPQVADDPQTQKLFALLEKTLSNDALAEQMRTAFPVFPQGAVHPGDHWDDQARTENPAIGAVVIHSTYTAGDDRSIDGHRCRELAVITKVEMTSPGAMVDQLKQALGDQAEISFDEMASSGSICVEYATGMVLTGELNTMVSMSLHGAKPGSAAESMEMKLRIRGDVKLRQTLAHAAATPAQ